ncbi:YwaF family protein [Haloplasma contractile]|uniref:YwaF protein n=1 Tax=Haloplasma contractile SSD-17B TaxID=1033810 RepID=F7PVZ7_9MOLU|nr:TIGR02206 family membrane protein [Haloplasma contractile]ERJ12679.1 YwaF protein [Haloplasma contractile SSD-17B]
MSFGEFFNVGVEGEFAYFTLAHFLPILIAISIIVIVYKKQDFLRSFKFEPNLRLILAFTLIVAEMSYFWQKMYIGSDIKDHLPLTICGWTAIFTALLLLSHNKFLFDVVYFWALAGSLNALITPAVIVDSGPMHFRYYQFWVMHLGIFIGLFYMIFVYKMRPTFVSFVKSYVLLAIFGVFCIYVNRLIPGANYLFLASTEAGGSALNFLPSNIVQRALVMGVLMLLLYFTAYLPYFIRDRRLKNKDLNVLNVEQQEVLVS